MKKLVLLSILISFVVAVGCNKEQDLAAKKAHEGTITWYSFNKGLELAKKEKKHIVIDFYADWCKWCKVMEEKTFTDPEVQKVMKEKFIAIKIYMDKPDYGDIIYKGTTFTPQQFSSAVGVKGLPTLLFMDSEGNAITTIPGYIEKKIYLPLLSYMNQDCYKNSITLADFINGNVDCKKK